MYDVGMSELSCDRSITVSDYFSSDQMSRLYVRGGPAARISNKYRYSDGTYHLVEPKDQGDFLLICPVQFHYTGPRKSLKNKIKN